MGLSCGELADLISCSETHLCKAGRRPRDSELPASEKVGRRDGIRPRAETEEANLQQRRRRWTAFLAGGCPRTSIPCGDQLQEDVQQGHGSPGEACRPAPICSTRCKPMRWCVTLSKA